MKIEFGDDMNRYTTKHFWRMNQDEQGAWVLHSEVETLKAKHEDQIADLSQEIDQLNADIKFYKSRADYYGRQIAKEYAEKLFYKQKLELLGHLPVALLGAGLVLCLGYSFDWQF